MTSRWLVFRPDLDRRIALVIAVLLGSGVAAVVVAAWGFSEGVGIDWPKISGGAWALLGVLVGTGLTHYFEVRRETAVRADQRAAEVRAVQERKIVEAQEIMDDLIVLGPAVSGLTGTTSRFSARALGSNRSETDTKVVQAATRLRSVSQTIRDSDARRQLQAVGDLAVDALDADDVQAAWGGVVRAIVAAGELIGRIFRDEEPLSELVERPEPSGADALIASKRGEG